MRAGSLAHSGDNSALMHDCCLRPRVLGGAPVSSVRAWWEGHAGDEHRRHGGGLVGCHVQVGRRVSSSGKHVAGALTLTSGPHPLGLRRVLHVAGG